MTILILTAFLFIAPPSVNDLPIHSDSDSIEVRLLNEGKLEFVETKIILTPADGNGDEEQHFSLWMPNRSLGEDYVLVSKPGLITYETVELVYDLLRSM